MRCGANYTRKRPSMALFRLRAFRENAKGSHKTQATASCGGYASTTSMALFRLRAFRENAKGSHKTQLAARPSGYLVSLQEAPSGSWGTSDTLYPRARARGFHNPRWFPPIACEKLPQTSDRRPGHSETPRSPLPTGGRTPPISTNERMKTLRFILSPKESRTGCPSFP